MVMVFGFINFTNPVIAQTTEDRIEETRIDDEDDDDDDNTGLWGLAGLLGLLGLMGRKRTDDRTTVVRRDNV